MPRREERRRVEQQQQGQHYPTERVEIVERARSIHTQIGRAALAGAAAAAAAMAIDETGYWAAVAAGLAAAAAVFGVPTGAAKTDAPAGEVEQLRQENREGPA